MENKDHTNIHDLRLWLKSIKLLHLLLLGQKTYILILILYNFVFNFNISSANPKPPNDIDTNIKVQI